MSDLLSRPWESAAANELALRRRKTIDDEFISSLGPYAYDGKDIIRARGWPSVKSVLSPEAKTKGLIQFR